MDTFEQLVTITKFKLANDQCFESFMKKFFAFSIDKASKTFTSK